MSTPVTEQAAALQVEATSRALHLPTVRQQAGALAEAALRDRLTHLAYLAEVLSAELDDRDARRRERRIHEARFPRLKHLAGFDLAAAPTVDPTMLATLERREANLLGGAAGGSRHRSHQLASVPLSGPQTRSWTRAGRGRPRNAATHRAGGVISPCA